MAVFGLRPDDGTEDGEEEGRAPQPQDKVYLWPCNVAAFRLWQQVQTQWRVGGMGDKTGLDYAGVTAFMRDVLAIKAKDRAELFNGLQAMEFAVLDVWAEQRASQAS
ncbi:MAG: DUF1799 domain-containing protein [Polaromonas sp.]|nr:DUF1799 domain-containing protein [Polaromonas sp.]